MASFIKNIFGRNKNTVNEYNDNEDNQTMLLKRWHNSQKTINNLEILLDIEDEDFIIKELLNAKTIFKLNEEKDFKILIDLIKSKGCRFKNSKIKEIFDNIKEFDNLKNTIQNKQLEVNKIIPEKKFNNELKNDKNIKNSKAYTEENLAKFDFEYISYFLKNNRFVNLVYSDKKRKTLIYFSYLQNLINNIFDEGYIKRNFLDFYNHANTKYDKINLLTEELSLFVFSTFFKQLITKENYFEIIYNLIIDIENIKDNETDIIALKNCLKFLMPNKFNYRKLNDCNFFRKEFHLNFLFTDKKINSLIEDKELVLDMDLINTFFNFIVDLESFVSINEKKAVNTLLTTNQIIKPNFFKVYDYLTNIIFDNYEPNNVKNILIDLNNQNEFKEFIFLDYLLSLYKITKRFNRNYNSKQLIDLDKDVENEVNSDDEAKVNNNKNQFSNENTECFNYAYNYNLEKFISCNIDKCINENVLAKEILTIDPDEMRKETNILNNLIDEVFSIVFVKSHLKERHLHINKKQNEINEAIDNNLIYNLKIKKLPMILFLKIIQMNSPIQVIENFIKKSVDMDIDKEIKNGFLKFVFFTLIKNSFEVLTENSINYNQLLERLALINNFYDTAKLIDNIKIKISFLEAINKKKDVSSKQDSIDYQSLNLKNLIFEEEKLFSLIKTYLKNNKFDNLNEIKKLLFSDFNNHKQYLNLEKIYEFILNKTNKFSSSKGIRFYKNNPKELLAIDEYLNLINKTAFAEEAPGRKFLRLVDFLLFFIKNEKLEIYSLEFIKENIDIYDQLSLKEFKQFIDLYANGKDKLKDKDIEKGKESLDSIANCASYFEKINSKALNIDANSESKNKDLSNFFKKELEKYTESKNEKEFYNLLKEIKFKITQLLKVLKLKRIFIENALNIDLKDFDYENLNVNTIIEVFIVKKFNLDLINDINDFYSKTTDIREALGLSWDEYLIELAGIFFKYKMNNMYANILNVFLEKNYNTFEKCLLHLKKDKNFDLIKFVFEKKFELKIIENSQNLSLINQIIENLNIKKKLNISNLDDLLLSDSVENQSNKNYTHINNKAKIQSSDFDKSEFFAFLDYSKDKKKDSFAESVIKEHYNFKKDSCIESEYLAKFKEENNIKDNFIQLLDLLNNNFDLEKFNNSRNLKGQVENTNNSYSLHPKLIELLDKINYNYRGKEFKLNTNTTMKGKLYKKILLKNFCAVENILQWENFSFDLKNLKNLQFLQSNNFKINSQDNKFTDESYLIISADDEKIFYLMNLLSLIYTGKDTKFDLIFENLTNIFIEKFEKILFSLNKNEKEINEEITQIKTRIIIFIMDSIYYILKNSKSYNYSNLLFWRIFIKILIEKIKNKQVTNNYLVDLSEKLKDIQIEFLHFVEFNDSNKNKSSIANEDLEYNSKRSDFILNSIQMISHQFNILLLFGEEFLLKYDYDFKIRNYILKPELDDFCRRYNYFKILKNNLNKISQNSNKDIGSFYYQDFHLHFICNIFKNLTLNNIFNFTKILNAKVLSNIFHFNDSFYESDDFINVKHLLGIKLVNNLSNISGFMNVDQSLSFLVFNYLKNYVNTENEFREIVNEILFVPKFNILLDASSNINLLEKNLNHIVKDYFDTKINIFNQITNLFKDKFKISPIAETMLKLLKIKKFICDSFNSNLRNVFSEINEMDNYQDLENYIKDERFKKEIYKIYSQS